VDAVALVEGAEEAEASEVAEAAVDLEEDAEDSVNRKAHRLSSSVRGID